MKTTKNQSVTNAKNQSFKLQRARARAASEASKGQDMARGRMAARGLFDSPVPFVVVPFLPAAGFGPLVRPPVRPCGDLQGDDLRALQAGLLTLADLERIAADDAAEVEAARRGSRGQSVEVKRFAAARAAADDAAAVEARTVGNRNSLARLKRLADCAWPGVSLIKRRLTVSTVEASPSKGATRKVNRGKGGESVHSAANIRAAAARLLRDGWRGKVAARAARIGSAAGMRWLKRNSRREALAISEVGAAAGVNDRGAAVDWGQELQSIAGAVHLRAAAYAVAIEAAPLPPCFALVAAGMGRPSLVWSLANLRLDAAGDWEAVGTLTGGRREFRAALVSRGKRAVGSGRDGKAVSSWDEDNGRRVAAVEIETVGRGVLWQWAARQSAREMHAARYGLGGRDGREVAADWQACGTVSGSVSRWWDSLPDGAAFISRRNPTRRPSIVEAARDCLALAVWSARKAVEAARRQAAAAGDCPLARMAAGSALGAARRGLSAAVDRSRVIGQALRGESLVDVSAWVATDERGNSSLTSSGRSVAKRLRDSMAARAAVAVAVRRPMAVTGGAAGDELATAAGSLMQSGDGGADLRAALAAMAAR